MSTSDVKSGIDELQRFIYATPTTVAKNEGHRSLRMSTVVVEARRGLGHTDIVSYDAPSCGRGPIRNCIGRGQRVKRRKRGRCRLILYSTPRKDLPNNSDTSVAHNSLLLTVRVGRKAFLTNPIDCRQRCGNGAIFLREIP
jgi:hypothetical protein